MACKRVVVFRDNWLLFGSQCKLSLTDGEGTLSVFSVKLTLFSGERALDSGAERDPRSSILSELFVYYTASIVPRPSLANSVLVYTEPPLLKLPSC